MLFEQAAEATQNNDSTFKILAILSPFLSGIIIGFITNKLSNKSKKMELLYQSKIPAFKEIHKALIMYRTYLNSIIAENEGNEFYPQSEQTNNSLGHRGIILEAFELNGIYLNKSSKKAIEDLIGNMSILCNIELWQAGGTDSTEINTVAAYEESVSEVDKVIELLYKDLNL
ncbi:hypothetical protein FMM05_18015 [Flavobacterium zepuense]|uniref:Uncharacterized protein n=1 Tax=Flavobacterium zepuense TaxID=2593302 RepID=A0A552UW15_9FLAO|nr:hypothetical protein [Flavobacterium zepuense]TRW22399.1 hypothetical protein FMM05_18015 [Flavobacterium zepuense]